MWRRVKLRVNINKSYMNIIVLQVDIINSGQKRIALWICQNWLKHSAWNVMLVFSWNEVMVLLYICLQTHLVLVHIGFQFEMYTQGVSLVYLGPVYRLRIVWQPNHVRLSYHDCSIYKLSYCKQLQVYGFLRLSPPPRTRPYDVNLMFLRGIKIGLGGKNLKKRQNKMQLV